MNFLNKKTNIVIFIFVLGLAVLFAYKFLALDGASKSLKETINAAEVVTENQLQQQFDKLMSDSESKVKIPTHHSDTDKK